MKHPELLRIIGFAMLVAGFTVNYIIARRRFNRRSMTGFEGFKSFENVWLKRLAEKFGVLVAWLLIITGVIILALSMV